MLPPIFENEENKMFTPRFTTRIASIASVLMLTLSSVQFASAAPSNDNFADAMQISSLPFNVNQDTTGATFEDGEPTPGCWVGFPLKTVWFAYTPSTNTTLTARSSYSNFPPVLAIYTGTSLGNLAQITCGNYYPQLSFQAQAGVTYYFQMSGLLGDEGTLPFSLEVTPPPPVSISFSPSDPSTFDNVSFNANGYDPGGIWGFTYAWTISDGTTSDQGSFNHQFSADGDYTVNLIATTSDGRSGSASQVIRVKTHDVAITRFSVPQTARANQTKTINVDLKNNRYSEDVQVTLYKGLPGGGEQVIGTLTLYVPARSTRATTFKFSYTFTPDDATIGKVTFKVIATIVNGRDALPADNTSIATTIVSK